MRILPNDKRSVYFTENSGYRSLKNHSCVTVFGSCSATLTVGEPLGDVSCSANHNFRTSVTGISGEIDASNDKFIEIFAQRLHYFEDPFYNFFALNLVFQDTSYSLALKYSSFLFKFFSFCVL